MIIHSPIISGSLTFADGSTFTLPDGGNYSGSFSGSVQISEIQSHLIPNANEQYDLGSDANRFRDLYLSNNSIVFPSGSFGFGSNGFGISDPSGNPAPFVASQLKISNPDNGDIISLQVIGGQLETTATNSEGTPVEAPTSNLSGSFTGSFTGLYDGVDIVTLNSNVDAILSGSTADKDSFAEIVTLINSVDTTNDDAFASFYTASNDRFETIEGFTSSIDTTIKTKLDADGIVSGSSQVTSLLPIGAVSASIQVDVLQTTNFTDFSSSIADTFDGLSSNYVDLIGIPSGIISSSEQLAADFLDTLGDNVVSSSQQIDLTQTTNYASGIKTKLDAENVFSSSQQVTIDDTDGFTEFSSSVSDTFDGLSSNYVDLIGIPSGIVSGSSQIDVTQTTNYSTVSSHISSTSNPHSVTATQVGLGNVDNTSDADKPVSTAQQTALNLKATVSDLNIEKGRIDDLETFSSSLDGGFVTEAELASATGALETTISNHSSRTDNPHGVTKAQVGLGNVTNESKATMFTSPTFTGTVSGVSKAMVGLGNVDNTSDADKPVSTAQQTALDGKLDTTHDFSITLTGDVTGTGTVTNMGNVSFATVVGDDSHNHTIANVDGLQDALDGKQSAGSYVTTTSDQSLKGTEALTLSGNTLTLTKGDDSTDTIDLSAYLDEDSRSISSGTLNSVSGVVTFTRDDASTFTLDLSDLLDDTNLVTSVNGRNGVVTTTLADYSITATAAEINKLDGVTATTAELNYVDGVTSNIQTQLNGKQASLGFTPYNSTNPAGYTTYTSNQATNTNSNVNFNTVNINATTASTTKTTGALIVDGGVGIDGALNVGGDVVAYASSDKRLKDNIVNIENPIEKVQKLNGVTWDWNGNADELQQSLPNVGVIAQEVEEVFPQLVHDRDNGYKGVDYAKLTGLLIEAVKEQQKQIDELKSRLG